MSIGRSEPEHTHTGPAPDEDDLDDYADQPNPDSGPIPYKAHTSSSRTTGTGLPARLATDRRLIDNALLVLSLLVIVVGVALLAVGGAEAGGIAVGGAVLIGTGGVALATVVVLRVRARVKRGKRRHTAV